MQIISTKMIAWTTATAITMLASGAGLAQQREIVIGIQCDRTGATQIVGVNVCPAYKTTSTW